MADDLFSVAGKVALVTGGTSGIGTMIARGFVRRGVRTYITARDAERSAATAAELYMKAPASASPPTSRRRMVRNGSPP